MDGLEEWNVNNGETVSGPYPAELIDDFNQKYDNATANGAEIPTDAWNFESYLNNESVVGNYVANFIQNLPDAPDNYVQPAT